VQDNIPPDALLAVHDIGALGICPESHHRSAGLITPEVFRLFVIQRAQEYLDANSADI